MIYAKRMMQLQTQGLRGSSRLLLRIVALTLMLLLLAPWSLASAQSGTTASTQASTDEAGTPDAETLRSQIQALEGAEGLDPELHKRLLDYYRQALEHLADAERYATTRSQYQQTVQQAPAEVKNLEAQTQGIEATPEEDAARYQNASLNELEQVLAREKGELAALESRLSELESQIRSLRGRPQRARDELDQVKQQRSAIETALQETPPADQDSRIEDARRAALLTERLALNRHVLMLEQELLSHDARLALATARRNLLARQTEVQRAFVQELQALANAASRAEAAAAASTAARAAEGLAAQIPALGEAVAENARLGQQLDALISQIEEVQLRQREVSQNLQSVRSAFDNTRQQLEIAGLSEALGEALRRERLHLPPGREIALRAEERNEQMAEAALRQFQLAQTEDSLTLKTQVEAAISELPADVSPELEAAVRNQLRQLLEDRQELQEKLAINYGRYVDVLSELVRDENELTEQIQQYRELLDESLFWIASAPAADLDWLRSIGLSLSWLLDTELWLEVASRLVKGFVAEPIPPLATLIGILLLLRNRTQLRESLEASRTAIGDPVHDRFSSTLRALLITLLLTLPYPALVAMLAWILTVPGESTTTSEAAGLALRAVAGVALALEGARQMCRPGGVAESHLRWGYHACRVLRRNLTWLLIVALPLAFVISFTEWVPEETYRNGLGRLGFVLGSCAMAVFAHRLLRPEYGLWHDDEGLPWGLSLRPLLYPITIGAPLLLALLALSGYYYTALQLESRMFTTGGVLVGAAVMIGLILRSIRVAERRLTQRRLEREVSRELEAAEDGEAVDPYLHKAAEPDLRMVDEHTRSLLRVVAGVAIVIGLWLIWSDLLPALNVLNEVVLWRQLGADGTEMFSVTLVDVLTALVLISMTMLAARNLPGVLEITVLSRLAVDPGNRYAITTISRYFIVGVGIIVALGFIGVSWGQAQWLIAALGVGLGFGLQEIFANFISGLILLFERPIRVGDTVTVGQQTGRVTRIRIRATTITDWDRKELIIPNKMFITDQLINWTLSDAVTRLVIPFNVGPETDPKLIRDLVLAIARKHPKVLDDPEPSLFFTEMLPGAQRFTLYVHVPELGDRLSTQHELLDSIRTAFREQGIRIPYPQQDVHIRSMPQDDP